MPLAEVDAILTVLVWDAADAVARLFASLERGVARRANWQLYVLDQGSERPTRELVENFSRRQSSNIFVDRLEQNIGYPAGHNRLCRLASARARFRYLITINSDVEFTQPNWLDALVTFCDERPAVGICGPSAVRYQREPPDRLGWCREATAEERDRGEYDSISGSVCAIRHSMIEQIGLFDESFSPGYYEDTDLAFRAKASGWQLAICPVPHLHGALGEGASTSQQKREILAAHYGNFQKRNRNLFVQRWLSSTPDLSAAGALHRHFPGVYFPETRTASCLAIAN